MSESSTLQYPVRFEKDEAYRISEYAARIVQRGNVEPISVLDAGGRSWKVLGHDRRLKIEHGNVSFDFSAKYAIVRFKTETDIRQPMTYADIKSWRKRLDAGDMTAQEVKSTWERVLCSYQTLMDEFMAMKKDELAGMVYRSLSGETKPKIAASIIDGVFNWFTPSSYSRSPFTETIEEAIGRQVERWTDEKIQSDAAESRTKESAFKKAISEPETLEEFDRFVEYWSVRKWAEAELAEVKTLDGPAKRNRIRDHAEKMLTPAQLEKYDALRAAAGRQRREAETARKMEVQPTQLPQGAQMEVKETVHTVKGHKLWVVQLNTRVERDVFDRLNERAKKLGGYYSSFSRNGAVPGFQFTEAEKAQSFMSLERIDGAQRLEERKEERRENAVAHLANTSARLVERGEDKLYQDRKENTARRAAMAASAEANARATMQLGQTIGNLADAVANREVSALERIRTAAQVETFERVLRAVRWARLHQLRQTAEGLSSTAQQEVLNRPFTKEDAVLVEYPWPSPHWDHLRSLIDGGRSTPGAKLLAERVHKFQVKFRSDVDVCRTSSETSIESIRELAQKMRYQVRYRASAEYVLLSLQPYDRLRRMDIHNEVELRAAVREYIDRRADAEKADPIKQAERALQGSRIPGFFPTPPYLAAEIVRQAEIEPGMTILEPEAGKGDLADMIRSNHPDAKVDVVEQNYRLVEILKMKGHNVAHYGDFLNFNPGPIYDRIVMNPPFENSQDIDHVRHAYDLLALGGRLVAIVSESPFFNTSQKAQAFREWLNSNSGSGERNQEGAFAEDDAFRGTGVMTRTVVSSAAANASARKSSTSNRSGSASKLDREAIPNFCDAPPSSGIAHGTRNADLSSLFACGVGRRNNAGQSMTLSSHYPTFPRRMAQVRH